MVDLPADTLIARLTNLSESDWCLGKERMLLLPQELRSELISALKRPDEPSPIGNGECLTSPTGRHIVDTSMESGPNNCFHCDQPMGARHESK